jgi:hypothetical protein
MRPRFFLPVVLMLHTPLLIQTQREPLDLFLDGPALNAAYICTGVWNLRHINLEGSAHDFLAGATEREDFKILTAG